jgi:hypothetical protein
MMMDINTVEGYLATVFAERGFKKRRLTFNRALEQADLLVEIQRSTWSKQQHFLNFALTYRPDACRLARARTGIGVWGRVESLDPERKQEFLDALHDGVEMTAEQRYARLRELIDGLFLPLIAKIETIGGGRDARQRGELSEVHAPRADTAWDL